MRILLMLLSWLCIIGFTTLAYLVIRGVLALVQLLGE